MYQPEQIPTSHPRALATVRCHCGWTGPSAAGPALRWLVASHVAGHDPEHLVLIPAKEAFALELAFARARGSASVVAPDLVYDLAMAGRVLCAADHDEWSARALSASLLAEVAETACVTSAVLRDASRQREVVDELDGALDELARRLAGAAHRSGTSSSLAVHAPQIRLAAPPELEHCLRGALDVLATPLLLELPPFAAQAEAIEGRPVRDLVAELFSFAPALRALEASLRRSLTWVERNLCPLPVVTDAVLDALAEAVVELHLGTLAATRLGELLVVTGDEELVRWALATSGVLITRLRALADQTTTVLEVLDRPA